MMGGHPFPWPFLGRRVGVSVDCVPWSGQRPHQLGLLGRGLLRNPLPDGLT